jgi:hypothetical protein
MAANAGDTPLGQALRRSADFGLPVEIWVAIANGLSVDGERYGVADAEAFARAHPKVVRRFETHNHFVRYERSDGAAATHFPPDREGGIAVELLALFGRQFDDDGVVDYLERCLPDQCADGNGRGLDGLRARAGEPGVDKLRAKTLTKRARYATRAERAGLLREAISVFAGLGDRVAAADARAQLSAILENNGERQAALEELRHLLSDYRGLAQGNSFYDRFVAATLLNLGRLRGDLGDVRQAKEDTKLAVAAFQRVAARDHRFIDEVQLAKAQLSRLRWRF